jgi:hypothetical protein
VSSSTLVQCTLSLAVLALPSLACQGEAQSRSPQAVQEMEEYRLTAPMVRKVSAVMREWNPVGGLGALMFGGTNMTEAQFEALPEAEQERILVEGRRQAEAKEEEGRKLIGKLLTGNLAQRTAEADQIPALKAAITHAGLSTPEFVAAFVAYHSAMDHLFGEEMRASSGEALPPMPPGIRKDNVELIRPMEKAESLWTYMGG